MSTSGDEIAEAMRRELLGDRLQLVTTAQVTTEAAARLPRQALEATRNDLLAAGRQLALQYLDGLEREGGQADPLAFVKLDAVLTIASEIARRRLEKDGRIRPDERIAPLTPGAFYKAFADMATGKGRGAVLTAFRRRIVREIVTDPFLTNAEVYRKLAEELHSRGEPWSEMVREGIAIELERRTKLPASKLIHSLGAFAAADKEVTLWLQHANARQISELADLHQSLLELYERRMRPGLTIEQLSLAISNLITGAAVNPVSDPDQAQPEVAIDVDGHGVRRWTLCALSAWSTYNLFTKPQE